MLDYRIDTFIVVCQEMNFTKAAKRLNISQPAVSNHIKQLEEYYNAILFGYEGKKIYLTKEGKMLYEAMVSMHNNEIYLREQINQEKEDREVFKFGVTMTIGEFMISEALNQYVQSHPKAQIHMTVANTEELVNQLEMGLVDFAIVEGNFQKLNYENLRYSMENFIPVCSPYHRLAKKQVDLSELVNERLIIREMGSGTRDILEMALEEHNMDISDFENVMEIGNMNAIKKLLEMNCGISFMYECAVRDDIEEGSLVKLNVKGFNVRHEMCAIWKKDNIFADYYEKIIKEMLF